MASLQMLVTPIDGLRVHVHATKFGARFAKKPSNGAAASATEIQDSMRVREIDAHVSGTLSNQIGACLANLQESIHRKQFTYAIAQNRGRYGRFDCCSAEAIRPPKSQAQDKSK